MSQVKFLKDYPEAVKLNPKEIPVRKQTTKKFKKGQVVDLGNFLNGMLVKQGVAEFVKS